MENIRFFYIFFNGKFAFFIYNLLGVLYGNCWKIIWENVVVLFRVFHWKTVLFHEIFVKGRRYPSKTMEKSGENIGFFRCFSWTICAFFHYILLGGASRKLLEKHEKICLSVFFIEKPRFFHKIFVGVSLWATHPAKVLAKTGAIGHGS